MYTTISNCTQITSNSRDYKELEDLLFQPFYASTEENRRNKVWKQQWKKSNGKTGDAFAFSQKKLSGQSLYISSNFL